MRSLMAPGPRIRYGRKRLRASETPALHAWPAPTRKPKSTAKRLCRLCFQFPGVAGAQELG